jgi:hypothetical protein
MSPTYLGGSAVTQAYLGASAAAIALGSAGVVQPGYLTGTPMATLPLTVTAGSYPFAPTSYSRQMQVSDDGVSGWADTGAPFAGTSFVVGAGLVGKYLRLVETATDGILSITTTTAALGPVSAFVALAATPVATGEQLWAIGDSQLGYSSYLGSPVGVGGNNNPTLASMTTGYGFVAWTQVMEPRFRFDTWYDPADPLGRNFRGANEGLFGDHLQARGSMPGIIPRIPALVARMSANGGKVVFFNGGVNTISSDDDIHVGDVPFTIQQIDLGLALLRKAGINVVLLVPYPVTAWPAGDRRYAVLAAVQAWCQAQAGRSGVTVLDANDILAPGGAVDATMIRADGFHLTSKAAIRVAKEKFVPIIQALYSAGSYFDQDVTVANLLTASQVNMDGTGGAATGGTANMPNGPSTGVPTGYTVTRNRNCSIVNSIDDYVAGKHRLNLAITPYAGDTPPADNGEYFEISIVPPAVTIATGEPTKWYQSWFFCEIDEMKDISFIESLYGLYVGTNTVVHRSLGLSREASGDYAKLNLTGPLSFWLTAPAVYNQSGNATINGMRGSLRLTGNRRGSPFNFRISRPIVRQVSDPRPALGY